MLMAQGKILKTESVSVGYGGKVLIGEVAIGAAPGEIVTLIGPNGAGKSTILKSIAGQLALIGALIAPATGTIVIAPVVGVFVFRAAIRFISLIGVLFTSAVGVFVLFAVIRIFLPTTGLLGFIPFVVQILIDERFTARKCQHRNQCETSE
jgi:ABC-type uncharacterized transport system YnjBCD ATPase subunit